MRSRRDLLMGLGAVFSLTGCAETAEPTSTPVPTQESTATRVPTTAEPTASPTSTPTETETQTETSTPDPRVSALNSIEQKITAELSDFAINAEIDTRSLEASISDAGNNNRLYTVREELGDLDPEDLTDEQRGRYSRLQSAFWFVWWIELLHNDTVNIVDAARSSWENERGAAGTGLPIDPLEGRVSTASDRLENLQEDSSEEGLAELDGYEAGDYQAFVNRYDNVISQGELLIEQINLHREANLPWRNEKYQEAEEKYASNVESYREKEWLEEFQPVIDEMVCYDETMVERCQEFYRAKRLEEEGEEEDAEVTRELAPDPEEECSFGEENETATPEGRISSNKV